MQTCDLALDLGGTESEGPAAKQSAFKVRVKDTDGAVGENTFTVAWHKPVENWEPYSILPPNYTSIPGTTPNTGLTQQWETRSTNVIDATIPVWIEPSPWQCKTLLSSGQHAIVAAGFATLGGMTRSLMLTGGMTAFTKQTLNTWAILTGSSAAVGLANAKLDSCQNSYQQFVSSVNSTKDFNNHVQNADARVFPETLVDSPGIYSMQSQFTMTPWVKRTTQAYFFKGDEYGITGYLGETRGFLDIPLSIEVVGQYELTGQSNNG